MTQTPPSPDAKRAFNPVRLALFAAFGVTAAILGLSLSMLVFGPPAATQSARSLEGRLGGAFQLVDQSGAAVDQTLLEGKTSLVYFGFTYCPDFCPTELSNMTVARDIARARGSDLQLVFITIDPERDTSDALGEYVDLFGEGIVALTGGAEAIAEAADAYGVVYQKAPLDDPADPDAYTMNHTTLLYAVGPDARVMRMFRAAEDPNAIVEAITPAPAG